MLLVKKEAPKSLSLMGSVEFDAENSLFDFIYVQKIVVQGTMGDSLSDGSSLVV